ncbi:MAG: hypothetical protein M0R80_05875 [Proteobacteria bacterium]|jgi:Notch-like protein|nr:hypothetical protein [Pseudomonadota bacterium]
MIRRKGSWILSVSLLTLGWVAGCSHTTPEYNPDAGPDTDTSESCAENDPCGEHGTCDDTSGVVQCDCEAGWSGEFCDECAPGWHAEGAECVLDESCLPSSCSGHGTCEDASGVVLCDCEAGYVGTYCEGCDDGYHFNGEGNCVADDSCLADSCSYHGTCDDATGLVVCDCDEGWDGDFCNSCAPGFHAEEVEGADAGSDETCVLDQTCLPTSCDGHGTCEDSTGVVVCDCGTGYTGQFCADCDTGYHEDGGGCVLDEACPTTGACSGHGTCDDTTGEAICTCDLGWDGDTCSTCAAGFHDDGAGGCVLDETCLANTCDQHGTCDDSGDVVVCDCDAGYLPPFCSDCDDNYHTEGDDCVADETCGVGSCSGNGVCDDTSGLIECQCDDGWDGDACSTCAAGYHDDFGDCVLDESCLPGSCAYNGDCDDTGGIVVCTCDPGYDVATYCSDCADGYHYVVATDTCVADTSCDVDTCNLNGDCDDTTGEPICDCYDGWDGDFCNSCAPGFHSDAGDCVLDEQCMPNSCSGDSHGSCDDSSGEVVCTCIAAAGYTGTYCSQCLADFHAVGTDCVADENCAAGSCSYHGACDDTSGVIECTCSYGWDGDTCNTCAPGFHVDGASCVLDESCLAGEASCSYHGTCADTTGYVVCTCDPNFDEASYCATCDSGYHLVGDACVVNEDCSPSPCGAHGDCVLESFEEVCECDVGWAGDTCATCAPGYHDVGGVCELQETCLAGEASCAFHGTCADTTGYVVCTCDAGYDPTEYCADCVAGYHWLGGACVIDEDCSPSPCGAHGDCSVVGGEEVCSCDAGYAGDTCATCAPGFQDNDVNGTCLVDCDLGTITCEHGGTCSDTDGTAGCACVSGWEGTLCGTCSEDSYEDNDYDSSAYMLTGNLSANLDLCGTDKDWFAIYLAETAVLDVDVLFPHSSSGDVDLYIWYLYDTSPSFSNMVAYSDSTTSNESASYTVPSGGAGKYLVEIRGAGAFVRNDYDLNITVIGPACNTCAYLGNDCGQWDDACGGEVDCDPLCPGLGTTHVCEEYQWGTCAQYYDDLWYGCCSGNVLHTTIWGSPMDVNCGTYGMECGWVNTTDQPPRTGYFKCNSIGTSVPAPPGVFSTCPAGMGWEP